MKHLTWKGFSINEGSAPNIAITWWPIRDAMFYLRTRRYRVVFGPGARKDCKGIRRVA